MGTLGKAITTVLDRGMLDDHFSGHVVGPCKLTVETLSGSRYQIDLPEGESTEFEHADADMSGTFHVRPGTVTRNDETYVGLVGFNLHYGALLVVDPETKCTILRSSSIDKIENME